MPGSGKKLSTAYLNALDDFTKRKEIDMSSILTKGVIRQGQVIVAQPIDLPDGTEVVVTASPPTSENDFEEALSIGHQRRLRFSQSSPRSSRACPGSAHARNRHWNLRARRCRTLFRC